MGIWCKRFTQYINLNRQSIVDDIRPARCNQLKAYVASEIWQLVKGGRGI